MRFEVGDVCLVVADLCGDFPDWIGMECIITEIEPNEPDGYVYVCELADGASANCCAAELRKKKPPEQFSDWDTIHKITGWKPEEVVEFRLPKETLDAIKRLEEMARE